MTPFIIIAIIIIALICIFLVLKNKNQKNTNSSFKIDLNEYKEFQTLNFNTYGKIKNLAMNYRKFEFNKNIMDKILNNIEGSDNWKHLPLTRNLKVLLEDYIISSSANAEDSSRFKGYIDIPDYITGYYYFLDKNKNRENIDETILSRQHLGFELFILNLDDNELYHIEMNL